MKFSRENLKSSKELPLLLLDFFMLILVFVNLVWLLFDALFSSEKIKATLSWAAPSFTDFYATEIHANFVAYDLIFVAIFLGEFLIRWSISIRKKIYHKWFFYPFVHWYDLIGCIPVGSFRWLRLLRIISIVYRLQKYRIIDISNFYIVRFVLKYFNILVEEISDRVVVHVLDGIQNQVATGTPLMEKIVQQVILPNKPLLVTWISTRINDIADNVYHPRRPELKSYIETVITESMNQDQKIAALEKIPLIGSAAASVIESTISDAVFTIFDRLVQDAGSEETDAWVQELADIIIARLLQPDEGLNTAGRNIMVDVIDVIKAEVRIQRWKQDDTPV